MSDLRTDSSRVNDALRGWCLEWQRAIDGGVPPPLSVKIASALSDLLGELESMTNIDPDAKVFALKLSGIAILMCAYHAGIVDDEYRLTEEGKRLSDVT